MYSFLSGLISLIQNEYPTDDNKKSPDGDISFSNEEMNIPENQLLKIDLGEN